MSDSCSCDIHRTLEAAINAQDLGILQKAEIARTIARWNAAKAAWERLLGYLTERQRETLLGEGRFDIQVPSGHHYRIYAWPASHNISRFAPVEGRDWEESQVLSIMCFVPRDDTYKGFTLLTQAMTLMTDEEHALTVACADNTSSYAGRLLGREEDYRRFSPWRALDVPSELLGAHSGKEYTDYFDADGRRRISSS